jgi:hypothetical protein
MLVGMKILHLVRKIDRNRGPRKNTFQKYNTYSARKGTNCMTGGHASTQPLLRNFNTTSILENKSMHYALYPKESSE